jgi:hypothetical protein
MEPNHVIMFSDPHGHMSDVPAGCDVNLKWLRQRPHSTISAKPPLSICNALGALLTVTPVAACLPFIDGK